MRAFRPALRHQRLPTHVPMKIAKDLLTPPSLSIPQKCAAAVAWTVTTVSQMQKEEAKAFDNSGIWRAKCEGTNPQRITDSSTEQTQPPYSYFALDGSETDATKNKDKRLPNKGMYWNNEIPNGIIDFFSIGRT